jgi:polysaccharide biosynthesis/export protein
MFRKQSIPSGGYLAIFRSGRRSPLFAACLALCALAGYGAAQQIQNPANPVNLGPASPQTAQMPVTTTQVRPTYIISPGDQMQIRARDVEEIDLHTFAVDDDGNLTLPLIGIIKAAGRTVAQLEGDIAEKLKTLVRNPEVAIAMTQIRQDTVLVTGAFLKTGIVPLQGRETLSELILQQGLEQGASRSIHVTRKMESGPIPLASAIEDSERRISTVDISLESLTNTINAAEDIVLVPGDTISASKAQQIYVQGAVGKTGTISVDERGSLSAMQVVIMSGGLQADAVPEKAEIFRPILDTSRRAVIPIDLKKVMTAKANDYPLLPNDVLFVPNKHTNWKSLGSALRYGLPVAAGIIFFILSRY